MSGKVVALDEEAARNSVEFSQLVALRWDLVPWGVVLDLNCSELPDGAGASRRGWMIFDGVSDLSWSLKNSRIPNGVMITNPIEKAASGNGFIKFTLWHLAPTFNAQGHIDGNPRNSLVIVAKGLSGFVSSSAIRAQGSWPNFNERNALATDADFLSVVEIA